MSGVTVAPTKIQNLPLIKDNLPEQELNIPDNIFDPVPWKSVNPLAT